MEIFPTDLEQLKNVTDDLELGVDLLNERIEELIRSEVESD